MTRLELESRDRLDSTNSQKKTVQALSRFCEILRYRFGHTLHNAGVVPVSWLIIYARMKILSIDCFWKSGQFVGLVV
jgi:hypothetical protein